MEDRSLCQGRQGCAPEKKFEGSGAGPLHRLALSLRISSAVLKVMCVWGFFPNNKKNIGSPKYKCIHVTFLPVFNSTSSGMEFYMSCIKNKVRNASQSYNGYFQVSKQIAEKISALVTVKKHMFYLTFMQLRSCVQEKDSSVPAFI